MTDSLFKAIAEGKVAQTKPLLEAYHVALVRATCETTMRKTLEVLGQKPSKDLVLKEEETKKAMDQAYAKLYLHLTSLGVL